MSRFFRRFSIALIVGLLCVLMIAACTAESADPKLTVQINRKLNDGYYVNGYTTGNRVEVEWNSTAVGVKLLDSGFYLSDSIDIAAGDSLVVRAWNTDGRFVEQSFGAEKKAESEIGEVWPEDEGAHNSNGTLALEGWYAVQDEDLPVELALYHVEWIKEERDGKRVEREELTQVGEPIDLSGKTELSEDELALHAKLWPEKAEVSKGYHFSIETPMYDFGITKTGQFRLILRWFDHAMNTYYEIGRCEPPFIVKAWYDWT